MKVSNLKTNYSLGSPTLTNEDLNFSWEISGDVKSSFQTAYQIEVSDVEDFGRIIWDSGIVNSEVSVGIKYAGRRLTCGKPYFWRVTVWGDEDGEFAESQPATWCMGIESWYSEWITPDTVFSDNAPLLRKEFSTEKCVRAVMYVYSPGWYEFYINGKKADDRVLAPNYSSDKYYFYDTYDVTDNIKSGTNCLGFWLGSGYCKKNYSKYTWRWKGVKRIIAELHLEYGDGSRRIIPTDSSWKCKKTSAITYNHIYDGEHFDARLSENWFSISYDDSSWDFVKVTQNKPRWKFRPSLIPPITVRKEIKPANIWKNASGNYIVDFGQNFAGWVRIFLTNSEPGNKVIIRYAESVKNGELDTHTNRYAKATDVYITDGSSQQVWEPRFTYHGFRYAEIEGIPQLKPENIIGCVVYAALEETGDFCCDYEPLNKLYSNLCWSIRSNAYSIMTDCPAREERTPCLMDSDTYKEMSTFLFDSSNYWKQWIIQKFDTHGFPDMVGVQINVAWHIYQECGDINVLKTGYPYFVKYIDSMLEKWPDLIVNEEFGDWCAPKKNPDGNYLSSFAYVPETGTALFYIQVITASKIAEVLNRHNNARKYKKLAERIKDAYNGKFYNEETATYSDGNLTAAVLPLYFGMVPEELKDKVYDGIIDGIKNRNNGHLDTGIFGTKYISLLLSENGDADLLFDAFFKNTYPSFGYQFEKNATTLWEQWSDARGDMISYNHAMFAGVGTFMHQVLAGICMISKCYQHVRIEPHMSSNVRHVICKRNTVYGYYSVEWTRKDEHFQMEVTVPFNCIADVVLPDGSKVSVNCGKHHFECLTNK